MSVRTVLSDLLSALAGVGLLLVTGCATANSNAESVSSQVAVGEKFLANGQYGKGYAVLEKVAQENARSATAALALADAYYREGAFLKSATFYHKAVDLGAAAKGKLGLARIELARNDAGAAKAWLQEVLAREPGNLDALNGMGVAHDLNGQHDLAQSFYMKVLARDSAHKNAHNNLSLSLALDGQASLAAPRIAELSRSNLNDETVRQNLAIVQYLTGDTGRALRTAMLDLSEREARQNLETLKHGIRTPE